MVSPSRPMPVGSDRPGRQGNRERRWTTRKPAVAPTAAATIVAVTECVSARTRTERPGRPIARMA